eukprot:752363-Hanusia_phi.AAC.6
MMIRPAGISNSAHLQLLPNAEEILNAVEDKGDESSAHGLDLHQPVNAERDNISTRRELPGQPCAYDPFWIKKIRFQRMLQQSVQHSSRELQ